MQTEYRLTTVDMSVKSAYTPIITRVAPDVISSPGPGRNPAVFFKSGKIRPRPDMINGFEAGFIKFLRMEHHYFPVYFSDSNSVSAECKQNELLSNRRCLILSSTSTTV